MEKLDILAFGPHPDDVELNIGGILALHAKKHSVGIVDLTKGEMASNGTPELRKGESKKAAELLGVNVRDNLALPDGGINPHDLDQQQKVVWAIRYYQPDLVLLPYWEDRHPDHAAASRLIETAIFKSELKKIEIDNLPPYRPDDWYFYLQHQNEKPDLIVDISTVFDVKMEAIKAYHSQFKGEADFETYINQPIFMQKIVSRDQYFGSLAGVTYGEGLITKSSLVVQDLLEF